MRLRLDKMVVSCSSVRIIGKNNDILEVDLFPNNQFMENNIHGIKDISAITINCKNESDAEILLRTLLIFGYVDISSHC